MGLNSRRRDARHVTRMVMTCQEYCEGRFRNYEGHVRFILIIAFTYTRKFARLNLVVNACRWQRERLRSRISRSRNSNAVLFRIETCFP
jgi:hypothetical protein